MDGDVIDLNKSSENISCERKPKLSNLIKEPNLKVDKKRCRHKRKVKLDTNKEKSLIITQKVRVKKSEADCIVNLNTNIIYNRAEKRNNPKQNQSKDVINCKSSLPSIERTVPMCFRCKCLNQRKNCDKRIKDEKQKRYSNRKGDARKKLAEKCQHNEIKHHKNTKSLTPISLELLLDEVIKPDDIKDVSYEDISSDSFSSETEIDTLIKRTKKREKLIEAVSPEYIEISSDIECLSSTNETINSEATYILESQLLQSYYPISLNNGYESISNYLDQNIINSVKGSDLNKPLLLDKMMHHHTETKLLQNNPYQSTESYIVRNEENNINLELNPKEEYFEVPIEYIKKE